MMLMWNYVPEQIGLESLKKQAGKSKHRTRGNVVAAAADNDWCRGAFEVSIV